MNTDQHMLSVILQSFLEIQSFKMMALSQSVPKESCSTLIGFNSILRTNRVCFPKKNIRPSALDASPSTEKNKI